MQQTPAVLTFVLPHTQPPESGSLIEIAPGVQWFRLPLPYRLDHVNIYLIEADDGWTVLDTGLGTDACREAWESVLSGPMIRQRLTSMIVTHFHPDHVGLAGWLATRFDLPLSMPRSEYLYSLALQKKSRRRSGRRYAPALLPSPWAVAAGHGSRIEPGT